MAKVLNNLKEKSWEYLIKFARNSRVISNSLGNRNLNFNKFIEQSLF